MLNNWLNEYKNSLKLIEVEEFFDLTFYRPLAFLLVKVIYNTNITPNQITIGAIIFSIIGGIIYSSGTEWALTIGALFFLTYNVLDCADGQLARLKKNGTSLGRIIDGFADYIAGTMAYLAIGFGFANNTHNPFLYWILVFAAAGSNILQSITLDYYRNRYLDYSLNRDDTLGDDLEHHREEFEKLSQKSGFYFQKLLYKIYFGYSALQILFISKGKKNSERTYYREDFLRKNKKIIWLWTFIGPTTAWTLFVVTSLIGKIEYYLWGLIIVFNSILLLLYLIQSIINKSCKQKK